MVKIGGMFMKEKKYLSYLLVIEAGDLKKE